MGYNTVLATQMVMGSSPGRNIVQCLWTCLQVCGLKMLGCHADLYTVSKVSHQKWIWGSHKQESMQKGIYPVFETQARCHQKSKTWSISGTPEGLMSSKHFFLKSHVMIKKPIWKKKTYIFQLENNRTLHKECVLLNNHVELFEGSRVFVGLLYVRANLTSVRSLFSFMFDITMEAYQRANFLLLLAFHYIVVFYQWCFRMTVNCAC